MNPTPIDEPEIITKNPKKRSLIKTIILTVIGIAVACGIGYGIWLGIETDQQITQRSNYRIAASDVNDIVIKYNDLARLESINTNQSSDSDATKAMATKDAATVESIIAEVTVKIDQLSKNKVFNNDEEAKKLVNEFIEKEKPFTDFYKLVADSYKLRAQGDFVAAAEKVMSGNVDVDSAFVASLNLLSQYLIQKANGE